MGPGVEPRPLCIDENWLLRPRVVGDLLMNARALRTLAEAAQGRCQIWTAKGVASVSGCIDIVIDVAAPLTNSDLPIDTDNNRLVEELGTGAALADASHDTWT